MIALNRASPELTAPSAPTPRKWSFLTNHALVLVYIILNPESTVRTISAGIGITERATLAILRDLDDDSIVRRHRDGRRNVYSIDFGHLSSVRRGGVSSPLTPRLFVDVVVKTLFEMSPGAADALPAESPREVKSADLQPRIGTWGFFTNHLLIVLAIATGKAKTVREMAVAVGITERANVGILNQLEADGIIVRHRQGRGNTYSFDLEAFRNYPGWGGKDWQIPQPLVDVATQGVRSLAERAQAEA